VGVAYICRSGTNYLLQTENVIIKDIREKKI